MKKVQRVALRKLILELTAGGRDLGRLPVHKAGLVARLRELDRNVEAERIERGAGFSLGAGEGREVWIINGGRREPLFSRMRSSRGGLAGVSVGSAANFA